MQTVDNVPGVQQENLDDTSRHAEQDDTIEQIRLYFSVLFRKEKSRKENALNNSKE
jgi:hypothetical protein